MTDVNPYPEHTMAFVDRFYTLDNSVQAQYGFAPEGIMQVDGVWVPQPIDPERRAQIATAGTFPSIFREEDFGPNLAMDTSGAEDSASNGRYGRLLARSRARLS